MSEVDGEREDPGEHEVYKSTFQAPHLFILHAQLCEYIWLFSTEG